MSDRPPTLPPVAKASGDGPVDHTADRAEVGWRPQYHAVGRSVEQYTKFVSIMKFALPTAAAVLLIIVIFLPLIREHEDRFRIGATGQKDANGNSLSMTNASFYGTDDKGQPYSITAQSVRQSGPGDKLAELTLPKAEITMTSGNWLSLSADTGVYDRDKQVIDLTGNVALYQYQGNELHTSAARIMLKDGSASGNAPVKGEGPFGTLEAGGFTYSKGDQAVHFTGHAHMVLKTDRTKTHNTTPTEPADAPAASAPASSAAGKP